MDNYYVVKKTGRFGNYKYQQITFGLIKKIALQKLSEFRKVAKMPDSFIIIQELIK